MEGAEKKFVPLMIVSIAFHRKNPVFWKQNISQQKKIQSWNICLQFLIYKFLQRYVAS